MTRGSSAASVLQLHLREDLRRLREQAQLTQHDVADALDWSVSKVLRIESGASRIGVTDLRAMLAHYGVVDPDVVDRMVAAARAGRARTQSWRDQYRNHLDPEFYDFLAYEEAARRIRQYQSTAFPRLLQTEPYIAALSRICYGGDRDAIDRAVQIWQERQRVFAAGDDRPETTFLLDEAVLHREVGDQLVMRAQLLHVAELAQAPHVTVRVVPLTAGAHRGTYGPSFTILDLDYDLGVVGLESRHSEVMIRRKDLPFYEEDFTSIANHALPPDDSVAAIIRVLNGALTL